MTGQEIIKSVFASLLPESVLQDCAKAGFTKKQIFLFYRKYFRETPDFKKIQGLSQKLIQYMGNTYSFPQLEILAIKKDQEENGKIAFKTVDGHIIESVFLTRGDFHSICISTQVGCKMNCAFCATGKLGFVRNLEPWEMLEQIRLSSFEFIKSGKKLTHITIMGMGEPFENFDNMYQAFLIMIHPFSYSIAAKRVTVATSGYLPGLKKLLEKKILPSVTFSIHAPNQEIREKLLPISKKYSLDEILEYIRNYPLKKNKRISIQYMLLKGINDQPEHAEELANILKGLPVKINFLKYNEVTGSNLEASAEENREYFINRLRESRFTSIRRKSFGADIKAACGQLGNELLIQSFQKQSVCQ